jgi:CubicO group peptidase (beta-lactamase class C family)
MTSGIAFDEQRDSEQMLFRSCNSAEYAANKTATSAPASSWRYSSGNSELLSRLVRYSFFARSTEATHDKRRYVNAPLAPSAHTTLMATEQSMANQAYWTFPQLQLFDVIGMRSASLAIDASGTFSGSTGAFATARDWARLGLLYANDGLWFRQDFAIAVLPTTWVTNSLKPTKNSGALYGGHWWLGGNAQPADPSDAAQADQEAQYSWLRQLPPKSLVAFDQQGGQLMVVVPAYQLVIVRMGYDKFDGHQVAKYVEQLMQAIRY